MEHGVGPMVVPVINNISITHNITILFFILILIITIMMIVIPWEKTGLQRGEGAGLNTSMQMEGLGQAVPHVNKKRFCVTVCMLMTMLVFILWWKICSFLKDSFETMTMKHSVVEKALGLESKFCVYFGLLFD